MDKIDTPYLIYAVGALVLLLSSLSLRHVGFFRFAKMALSWLIIFIFVLILFSYRYELTSVYQRVMRELTGDTTPMPPPASAASGASSEVHIKLGMDNHFQTDALVNGNNVTMMIDSGATFTAMGEDMAAKLGIQVDTSGIPRVVYTANGTVSVRSAKIASLQVGSIIRKDVTVFVAPEFGNFAVLGMNFLSTLEGWRVEKNVMILKP